VVSKMRSILKIRKIGHAGTLDPLATGLLILCTGKFTKRIPEFQNLEKEYTGTMVLGQTTETCDLESLPGHAVPLHGITEEIIENVRRNFIGCIQQIPPMHSAVKVNGKRAYDLARKGITHELEPRQVEVREFSITRIELPEVDFRIVCSKGTYIRSLVRDFGQKLEVGAYLSALRRTRIGNFQVSDAQPPTVC
jgi:tRNA pseudouridine55 synthase